jgi:ABC-type multidrug transport system ATPase subunit
MKALPERCELEDRSAHGGVSVRLDEVSVRLGGAVVLEAVSFRCVQGEWTIVTGPSGAGKSTLLRTVNGLCAPSHGAAWVLGSRIPGRSRRESREVWRRTSTVLQEVALFETKSARANVELGLRAAGRDRRAARHLAREWLERFRLGDKLDAHPWRLSGGERQRVALARALAPRPRLLVLDEPTSALDRETARLVLEAIKELTLEGTTVLMSSHRDNEVVDLCDRHLRLRHGRVEDADGHRGRPSPDTIGRDVR